MLLNIGADGLQLSKPQNKKNNSHGSTKLTKEENYDFIKSVGSRREVS